jgi:hypothetical protein
MQQSFEVRTYYPMSNGGLALTFSLGSPCYLRVLSTYQSLADLDVTILKYIHVGSSQGPLDLRTAGGQFQLWPYCFISTHSLGLTQFSCTLPLRSD